MNWRRWLSLVPALLPAAAAFVWASMAYAWPEPWLERVRAGEATWSASWLGCTEFAGEPMHAVMRLLLRAELALPGATFWTTAWLAAAVAFWTVWLLAELLRRSFALALPAHRVALALVGLRVATPAHGVVWLAGERVGAVLAPAAFVLALSWLQGPGRLRTRAVGALLLAVVAPFCHTNGIVVAFGLIPALLAAVGRAGSTRASAWLATAVLLGNLAAALSLRTGNGFAPTMPGYDTWVAFVARVGSAIGDVLPGLRADDVALGAVALAVLLVLPRVGDRSGIARDRAAPWWSCVWFALGVLALDVVRGGPAAASDSWRAATFGVFLLPIGLGGLLACRFGVGVLRIAAGALFVLAVQDWQRGVEDLRLARARGEQVEAALALPREAAGAKMDVLRDPVQVDLVRARGWAPPPLDFAAAVATAHDGIGTGAVIGGDANGVRGHVRSSLNQPGVAAVLVVDAAQPGGLLGVGWPDFAAAGRDRDVPWTATFAAPLAEGRRVVVLAFRPRQGSCERIGGVHVLQQGRLVAEVPR
ncbi:MAG: hypothetical protein JNK15_01535 [Planctomycetes bacterium]|nr:hypothetical protein [Planctomycetota bacterium]